MVNTSISSLLRDCAIRMPDAPAILAPGRMPLSFAGVWEQTQAMARALQSRGISNSTRVAIVLPNGPEMATAFLGTAACAACAPLNPGYQASEFRFYLEDTRAEAVLLRKAEDGAIRNVARDMGLQVVELESGAADAAGRFRIAGHRTDGAATATFSADDDVALILHTSGTTARPKSVPLTHANLMASAQSIARHLALTPVDRCLNVMPLFHIHGLVGALLATVAGGGSIVCSPGFTDADFFDWVAEFRPSWYTAVPTIHQAVAAGAARYRERATGHRFRFVRSSSAALPPATLRLLEEVLLAPVIEAYGMTEASHQMASNPLPPGQRKPGSVGLAAGADIAVMDDSSRLLEAGRIGEIVIRGPGVTRGYENNPQANAGAFVDGWFRTGDQGHLDERGYLHISGRLKEIVNRGGEKISPREIDDGLLEHTGVAQAVAFAVPHPSLGEDLAAAVVLNPGSRADEAELRHFLFARLSDFKVPSQILFVDAIPKGATGKVQRTTLHEKFASLLKPPFVAPETKLQRSVEVILREILECGPVGLNDNFFALGGDSLKGARAVARLNAQHDLDLPVIALFRQPTIAAIARTIEQAVSQRSSEDAALISEIAALSDEEVERLLQEGNNGR